MQTFKYLVLLIIFAVYNFSPSIIVFKITAKNTKVVKSSSEGKNSDGKSTHDFKSINLIGELYMPKHTVTPVLFIATAAMLVYDHVYNVW